jgi:hypothetical protein
LGDSANPAQVGIENIAAGPKEIVADIIERQREVVIEEWLTCVKKEPQLTATPLNYQEHTGHLPQLPHDAVRRLRMDEGTNAAISEAEAHHGELRSKQGYTVARAVEKFNRILPTVVTIDDEMNAELKQQLLRFMAADAASAANAVKAH